jgi:hypothetical protein
MWRLMAAGSAVILIKLLIAFCFGVLPKYADNQGFTITKLLAYQAKMKAKHGIKATQRIPESLDSGRICHSHCLQNSDTIG